MWGSGPDHVFAVGFGVKGVVLLWDGSTWKDLGAPDLPYASIWGSGPNDVFVVSADGRSIVRWNGKTWTPLPPQNGGGGGVLWGSGTGDLYVAGDGIVRWDGKKWSDSWRPIEPVNVQAIWGSGPGDIFAGGTGVIVDWNGTESSRTYSDPSVEFTALWGSGPNDVLAVGFAVNRTDPAQLLHWNGTTWSDVGRLEIAARKARRDDNLGLRSRRRLHRR